MKEKILRKETIEETLSQETICENISNLAGAISSLEGFDTSMIPDDVFDRLREARINIINGIHLLSTYLTTDEPV